MPSSRASSQDLVKYIRTMAELLPADSARLTPDDLSSLAQIAIGAALLSITAAPNVRAEFFEFNRAATDSSDAIVSRQLSDMTIALQRWCYKLKNSERRELTGLVRSTVEP